MVETIPKVRDKYITDKPIRDLTEFQQHVLLSRLNDNNIKNFDNDPNNVINSNVNIEKLKELATKLPDAKYVMEIGKKLRNNTLTIVSITDFDADGLSSAVTIEKCLETIEQPIHTTIFNKRKYGTGVTSHCLDSLFSITKHTKVDLIILADHGSSNGPEYDLIREKLPNVEIILTDHHQVDYNSMGSKPRDKFAFVNAHRTDVEIEDEKLLRSLSGCSIAYLTMLLLAGDKYKELEKHMYLPAISTISDVMPLDNPINRYIVKNGLNIMYRSWPDLYSKIMKATKINCKDLSFGLIPVINTGNRADLEEYAIEYLRNNPEYRLQLEDANRERKSETRRVVNELLRDESIVKTNIVSGMIDCEFNIAGNVASNIGEVYNKPTVLFNRSNREIITGSIRGIVPNVDVVKALRDIDKENDSVLIRYGGHKGAAGCSLCKDRLETFNKLFDYYIGEQMKNVDTTKYLYVDAYIDSDNINVGLYKSTEIVGPYGNKWEDIVYVSKLYLATVIPIGTMSKLILKTKSRVALDGIMTVPKSSIEKYIGYNIYVYYNLDVNNRLNNGVLELKVLHLVDYSDSRTIDLIPKLIRR